MGTYKRNDRELNEIRSLEITPNFQPNNQSSCLVKLGNTHVCCSAILEDRVPGFLRNSGKGWLTAEYGMLPSSTSERMDREAAKGRQSGRTQEIQRLIGRSLRCAVNLDILGEKTIKVDCDVISADGGTRTASITGGCVALFLAIKNHHDDQRAIKSFVAAVSMGIKENQVLLDLDYDEDSTADTDLNIVMNDKDELIEIQGTAEDAPFSKKELDDMLVMGSQAIADIIKKQKACIE